MVAIAKYKKIVEIGGCLVEVRLVQGNNGKKNYLLPRARYLNRQEIQDYKNR